MRSVRLYSYFVSAQVYLWQCKCGLWYYLYMSNDTTNHDYSIERREFVRELARALAKKMANEDYISQGISS
jgi:hypothetical protein